MDTRTPILTALGLLASGHLAVLGQTTTRILAHDGAEPTWTSSRASLSADGRYVVFESLAGMVPNDTNGNADVFRYDRHTGEMLRVSLDAGGGQVVLATNPVVSADGQQVAFYTGDDLVPDDDNFESDIYVRDIPAGTTTRVSTATDGSEGDGGCLWPTISSDGNVVAFYGWATNLVPGDTNGVYDVFAHDRTTGETTRVSVSSAGVEGNNQSGPWISVSGDGRYVVFESRATNLVEGESTDGVFIHDRWTGTTERVSYDSAGNPNDYSATHPSISDDGRYVAFLAIEALVPEDMNSEGDIYLRDLVLGTTTLVSRSLLTGQSGNRGSDHVSMSRNGRYVEFSSHATDLVPGDTSYLHDAYVYNVATGHISRLSLGNSGVEPNDEVNGVYTTPCRGRRISDDGRYAVFDSRASNLVADDTNGHIDVFIRDRGPGLVDTYCVAQVNSQGCVPEIAAVGTPSATDPSPFLISASSVVNNKPGILFYGFGRTAQPFLDGTLCVQPPVRRTAVQQSGGNPPPADCSGAFSFDMNAHIQAGSDPLLVAGASVFAQYWSRDPASPMGSNLTDAVSFRVEP